MADPVLYGYKILKTTLTTSFTLDLTTLLDSTGAALGPALGNQFTAVHIFVASNQDRQPAATGYTQVMDVYVNETTDIMLWAGYKFQPSTPDTSITITTGATSGGTSVIVIATLWDNVDPTTPMDVASGNDSGLNTALPNPASVTPATTGAVFLFAAGNATTAGATTLSESFMDWSVGDSRDGTSWDLAVRFGYKTGGVASTPYDAPALTWSGTDNVAYSHASNVMVLRPTSGGSPQGITGAVYTDTDAFGAGTVSTSVDITGALYSDADAFGAGTVVYDQAITGALYSDADSFGSGTVSAVYTVTGALYADPDSFGAGTLAASYTITGALYVNPDTFGAGAVVYDQAITGALFADADAFGAGTVALAGGGAQTITGAAYTNPDSFGAGTVTTAYTISGAIFTDADTFPTGAVSTSYAITGAAYSNPDSFGAGAVTSAYTIGGAVVANTSAFGAGTLSTYRAIIGALYASANSFGAGSISIVGSLPLASGHGIWPTGARYVRTVSSNDRAANALGDGRYIRILGRG